MYNISFGTAPIPNCRLTPTRHFLSGSRGRDGHAGGRRHLTLYGACGGTPNPLPSWPVPESGARDSGESRRSPLPVPGLADGGAARVGPLGSGPRLPLPRLCLSLPSSFISLVSLSAAPEFQTVIHNFAICNRSSVPPLSGRSARKKGHRHEILTSGQGAGWRKNGRPGKSRDLNLAARGRDFVMLGL